MSEDVLIFVCLRCLTPAESPGPCSYCGGPKTDCRPGPQGDLCRRPLIDPSGRVLTRAPIWWLNHTVPDLMAYHR